MKFKFSPEDGWEKAFENIAQSAVAPYFKAVRQQLKQLRDDALDYGQALASQRLNSTRQKYLSHLGVASEDDVWTIVLGGDASYLEEGYDGYDMIDAGLVNGPKAKFSSKTGRKYIHIPFEQNQSAGNKGHPMANIKVQQGLPSMTGTTKGSLAQDLKRLKKIFASDDQAISKDESGNPLTGKIWSIRKSEVGPQWEYQNFQTDMRKSMEMEKQPSPLLSGLTKVQFADEKGNVKAKYMTWRTATDPRAPITKDSKAKWMHPGFAGVHIMKDVERYINQELLNRINDLFSQ